MQFVIRDFALHPDRAELCLECAANASRQLRDGKNLGCLLKEVGSNLHGIGYIVTSLHRFVTSNSISNVGGDLSVPIRHGR